MHWRQALMHLPRVSSNPSSLNPPFHFPPYSLELNSSSFYHFYPGNNNMPLNFREGVATFVIGCISEVWLWQLIQYQSHVDHINCMLTICLKYNSKSSFNTPRINIYIYSRRWIYIYIPVYVFGIIYIYFGAGWIYIYTGIPNNFPFLFLGQQHPLQLLLSCMKTGTSAWTQQ